MTSQLTSRLQLLFKHAARRTRSTPRARACVLLSVCALVTASFSGSAAEPPKKSWFSLAPAEFAKLPEARQPIDFARFDAPLLSAALLHATNRRREKEGLPPLLHDPRAQEAAALQAKVMAERQIIEHENPVDPELRLPVDRIRKVGVKPKFVSENVAREFAIKYKGGDPFYTREEGGKTLFSTTADGPALPMHTYLSFAEALLDGWMASPSHRENILRKEPKRLGCSGAPSHDESGMEVLFCVQVFLTTAEDVSGSR